MQFELTIRLRNDITGGSITDEATLNQAAQWIGQNYGPKVISAEITPLSTDCLYCVLYENTYDAIVAMTIAMKNQFGLSLVDYRIKMRQ